MWLRLCNSERKLHLDISKKREVKYTDGMKSHNLTVLLLFLLLAFPLLGAGCNSDSKQSFPPKPPIPGMQQSPAIERMTP